ncbi:MAG: HAD-IIB family hydrolase [Nitrospirae bacterium]|nr:MAG: HAD-IIB family hydrolase [Nitrospirota bacterium]
MDVRRQNAVIGEPDSFSRGRGSRPPFVLFTDLDGTLLDAETYRYDAARPALDRLGEHATPLIICTSKTRAEVEPLRIQLGTQAPFIVENGGALYVPDGYFRTSPRGSSARDGYRVIEMGIPYPRLRRGLRRIEERVGASLVGFGDMPTESVMQATGLARRDAELARQREYDEPFLVEDGRASLHSIREAARQFGLTVVPGGRFHHLVCGTDKGWACRVLLDCYRQEWKTVSTAGIGDGPGDVPMLELVDRPFLVERPGGGHAEDCAVEGLTRVRGIGPAGWAEAVTQLLKPSPFQAGLLMFHPFPPSMC